MKIAQKIAVLFLLTAALLGQVDKENIHSIKQKHNFFFNEKKIAQIAGRIYANGWFSIKKNLDIQAKDFFVHCKEQMGLGPDDEMVLVKVDKDKYGYTHYQFRQFYKGIPVENEYILHVKENENRVDHANGKIVRNLKLSVKKAVTEADAFKAALNEIKARKYSWEANTKKKNKKRPVGKLVITKTSRNAKIAAPLFEAAYKFRIGTIEPFGDYTIYISVNNGEVIKKDDNIKIINKDNTVKGKTRNKKPNDMDEPGIVRPGLDAGNSTKTTTYWCEAQSCDSLYYDEKWIFGTKKIFPASVKRYYLYDRCPEDDFESELEAYDYDFSILDLSHYDKPWSEGFKNNSAHWGTNHQAATTGFWALQRSRNFFEGVLGETLGGGKKIKIIFNWDVQAPVGTAMLGPGNAIYINYQIYAPDYDFIICTGFSSPYNHPVSLDIIGHVLTRMFIEYLWDGFTGFDPGNETKALEQSYCDIFGAMIERTYTLDNENVFLVGEEICLIPGNNIRSMANPHDSGMEGPQPEIYEESPLWGYGPKNSGVQNKWFYLLAHGDSFNGHDVTGIGVTDAFEICYNALRYYMQHNSDYVDSRWATIMAAINIYGECSNQVKQTIEAWDAVKVPTMWAGQIGDKVYVNCSLVHQKHNDGFPFYGYGISHLISHCNVYTASASSNDTVFKSNKRITLEPGFRSGHASVSHFHAFIEACE